MMRPVIFSSALVLLALSVPRAEAQQLETEVTEACIRAAVKIVAVDPNGRALGTGSGSMIDPRGYVLTNFHVVGRTGHERGLPGTLYNSENFVHIATVEHARQAARPQWIGRVVRADVRLDLALIRIVSDLQGRPVGDHTFPTIRFASLDGVNPGTRVWAFGFPLNVRTINVTSGDIAGLEINSREQVSWIRSDAEFNPGNSGGMLVDVQGRLIGVPTLVFHGGRSGRTLEPVELARPAERIPAEWLGALGRGHIDEVRIAGVRRVSPAEPVESIALGDGEIGRPDQHFYRVGPGERPGEVATTPPLPIAVVDRGEVLRHSTGAVAIEEGDAATAVVSVLIPHGDEPVPYQVSFSRGESTPDVPAIARAPVAPAPTPVPSATPPAESSPSEGRQPPMPPSPFVEERPATPPAGATAVAGGRQVEAVVLDGVTGRPPARGALVLIGRPGVDPFETVALVLRNQISEANLRRRVVGVARVDATGRARVDGVLPGRYPVLVTSPGGYRPANGTVEVPRGGGVHSIGVIRLQPTR